MKAKVVIIGGGVIGASCLYHLAQKGWTDVVLFEKSTYASASTGKSAGIIETQYLSEEDIMLRAKSMPLFRKFHEEEGLPLEVNGYMRLGREEEDREKFAKSVELQKSMGALAMVLSPEEIKQIVPDLDVSDIKAALFGPNDGYLDPYILTNIFVNKAKELGAQAHQNTAVTGIRVEDGRVKGVETEKGYYECEYIINAAGGWADKIGEMIGVEIPVKAYRRQIVVLSAPDVNYKVPSVMDYVPGREKEGVYFRDERGGKIFAGLHWEAFGETEEPVDPDQYNQKVDDDYVERLAERLLETAPGFTNLGVQNGWAGTYPITPDTRPIVGELEEVKGFYNCVGFGGNGVQLSPVFGQAMADLLVDGSTTAIDVALYDIKRFKTGKGTE
ncbi:NAD(P)/FAD-dependent oxidoreductase [Brevibacillus marinus]|uniref:NAD(P)/FAD-dependent oxidoreductase n=1 Tax=Brevibacillus marinus TaxID=2496837 RepID=UPI0013E080C9|nr:FAD-binding oxidoreductase [Brevibacillus marinus]